MKIGIFLSTYYILAVYLTRFHNGPMVMKLLPNMGVEKSIPILQTTKLRLEEGKPLAQVSSLWS